MREFEFAFPVPDGPGKGPLLVAEKLAFQQGLGKGRTIERHERLVLSSAWLVDIARKQFFAGPAFPLDKNRCVAGGDFFARALVLQNGIP